MASNHTENYGLNQWERSDKVLMEDFNADNAKIDAALAAETAARTAAIAAQAAALEAETQTRAALITTLTSNVTKCGNCQVYTTSYDGTGTFGKDTPNKLTFTYPPALLVISSSKGPFMCMVRDSPYALYVDFSFSYKPTLTWSSKTLSWYSNSAEAQFNASGITYYVTALCTKS